MVATGSSILVRLKAEAFRSGSQISNIILTDDSGRHLSGSVEYTSDGTAIFQPESRFDRNQHITVNISIEDSRQEFPEPEFTYKFTTASRHPEDWPETLMQQIRELYHPTEIQEARITTVRADSMPGAVNDTLPPFYPDISITHWSDPSPSYTFVQPLNYPAGKFYVIILDNFATPVFYRSVPLGGMDFKLQPNGMLTWWDASVNYGSFFVMDDRGNMIDTIGMGNGYSTDLHELRMEEDGEFWTLGYDPQIVGMDTVVPGGLPDATVIGLIVQKLDADENVVFQWRSWDHYQITDATSWIILTDSIIDYVHGNSIALESDTSILISCRNMAEITKIDTRTGEMIWRLGGENNQFEYLENDQGFSVQHSIRKMNNGHFSIFDNGSGNTPPPHYSSAVEYIIDEKEMTATEVQRIRRTPDIHAPFMCHAQRMDNGNTVCGWGPSTPSVTEFDEDGNMLLEFSFPHANYRGFKFPWQTSLFDISHDTLDFGNIWPLENDSVEIVLTNHDPEPLVIHRIVNHGGIFEYDIEAPFTIPAEGEVRFTVRFEPDSLGQWYDVLTFAHEVHQEDFHLRLSRQLFIKGENHDGSFIPGYEAPEDLFKIFPNPNGGTFRIGFHSDEMKDVFIYSPTGILVMEIPGVGDKLINVALKDQPAGIYTIRVDEKGNGRQHWEKMVLIK